MRRSPDCLSSGKSSPSRFPPALLQFIVSGYLIAKQFANVNWRQRSGGTPQKSAATIHVLAVVGKNSRSVAALRAFCIRCSPHGRGMSVRCFGKSGVRAPRRRRARATVPGRVMSDTVTRNRPYARSQSAAGRCDPYRHEVWAYAGRQFRRGNVASGVEHGVTSKPSGRGRAQRRASGPANGLAPCELEAVPS